MEMKRAIIFDMDGVILNSEPLHEKVRQQMFCEMNIVLDDTFPDPVGKATDEFWELILKKLERAGDSQEKSKEHYRRVAELVEQEQVGPSEGLIEVLEWAKKNQIKIGIASSSLRYLVDSVLRILEIDQYFDCTVAGDEVQRKKPAPDIYKKALSQLGIQPEDAIAVEDSKSGIEAAKAAGIFCFGYQNPTSGEQNLQQADCRIKQLNEIVSLVKAD